MLKKNDIKRRKPGYGHTSLSTAGAYTAEPGRSQPEEPYRSYSSTAESPVARAGYGGVFRGGFAGGAA